MACGWKCLSGGSASDDWRSFSAISSMDRSRGDLEAAVGLFRDGRSRDLGSPCTRAMRLCFCRSEKGGQEAVSWRACAREVMVKARVLLFERPLNNFCSIRIPFKIVICRRDPSISHSPQSPLLFFGVGSMYNLFCKLQCGRLCRFFPRASVSQSISPIARDAMKPESPSHCPRRRCGYRRTGQDHQWHFPCR